MNQTNRTFPTRENTRRGISGFHDEMGPEIGLNCWNIDLLAEVIPVIVQLGYNVSAVLIPNSVQHIRESIYTAQFNHE